MTNPMQNPQKPTLTEIVRGTSSVGKKIAIGGKEFAIGFGQGALMGYVFPTVFRKLGEGYYDNADKAARASGFIGGVLFPSAISVGLGLVGMIDEAKVGVPYEPRWVAQGWDIFLKMFPYAFIGGNVISGVYEQLRYVQHRATKLKNKI